MKKLLPLDFDPLPLLANTTHQWQIIKIFNDASVAVDSNTLPAELVDKALVIKINVTVTQEQGSIDYITQLVNIANTIQLELSGWDPTQGRIYGDVIIDGGRLSELLVDSNLAVSQ